MKTYFQHEGEKLSDMLLCTHLWVTATSKGSCLGHVCSCAGKLNRTCDRVRANCFVTEGRHHDVEDQTFLRTSGRPRDGFEQDLSTLVELGPGAKLKVLLYALARAVPGAVANLKISRLGMQLTHT